jgi:pyruvate-formate lyase-activating enzyme
MEFRCPFCHSPIYSRKNKICGVCEKPLPEELLLSDEQAAALKKEMDTEEKRTKQFKQQMDDVGHHDDGLGIGGIASF